MSSFLNTGSRGVGDLAGADGFASWKNDLVATHLTTWSAAVIIRTCTQSFARRGEVHVGGESVPPTRGSLRGRFTCAYHDAQTSPPARSSTPLARVAYADSRRASMYPGLFYPFFFPVPD